MNRIFVSVFAMLSLIATAHAQTLPGELEVDPYEQSNANAGAHAMAGPDVFNAFGGQEGIDRIVDDLVDDMHTDPRIEGIMRASDQVRLRRTLKEQFAYLLGGPIDYTGRDMATSHRDHGITTGEFNVVVELLQNAMDAEGIPFRTQNKLLALLAPMHRDIATR